MPPSGRRDADGCGDAIGLGDQAGEEGSDGKAALAPQPVDAYGSARHSGLATAISVRIYPTFLR